MVVGSPLIPLNRVQPERSPLFVRPAGEPSGKSFLELSRVKARPPQGPQAEGLAVAPPPTYTRSGTFPEKDGKRGLGLDLLA